MQQRPGILANLNYMLLNYYCGFVFWKMNSLNYIYVFLVYTCDERIIIIHTKMQDTAEKAAQTVY